jgi:2-polyprenyl-3-methyl-5-hydroxy-6-metoxy-1,4-benzoquinol methylase
MEGLTKDKNVAWYSNRPTEAQFTPAARTLLENYSRIPADMVEDHVVDIHNEAWDIFPYPCIGQFRFLNLSLKDFEEYSDILRRLQEGQRLLDLGCCFGQEIRQLVSDGAPADNIYGCDLREEYITLGYKLFNDKDTLKANFLTANILDATSALTELRGQFDMIWTGSFFHLWGYEDQIKVSKIVASLLRPQAGSMILGRQMGAVKVAELGTAKNTTGKMFQHNDESFKNMWKDIGDDLGVSFTVDVKLKVPTAKILDFLSDEVRGIYFTIRRE